MGLKKGQTNNPNGRPKGSKNVFTKSIKDLFLDVFHELQLDDKAKLLNWAKENPTEFYRLISKMLPKEVEINENENGLIGKGFLPVDLKIKDISKS